MADKTQELKSKVVSSIINGKNKVILIAKDIYGEKPETRQYDAVAHVVDVMLKKAELKKENRLLSFMNSAAPVQAETAAEKATLPMFPEDNTGGNEVLKEELRSTGAEKAIQNAHASPGKFFSFLDGESISQEPFDDSVLEEGLDEIDPDIIADDPRLQEEPPEVLGRGDQADLTSVDEAALDKIVEAIENHQPTDMAVKSDLAPAQEELTLLEKVLANSDQPYSRAQLAELTQLTDGQVKRQLGKLKETGKVKMLGTGSKITWEWSR